MKYNIKKQSQKTEIVIASIFPFSDVSILLLRKLIIFKKKYPLNALTKRHFLPETAHEIDDQSRISGKLFVYRNTRKKHILYNQNFNEININF